MEPRHPEIRNESGLRISVKEEKLYQISKDEVIDLMLYTFIICLYLFCITLIYRRVFHLRPAVMRLEREREERRYGRRSE